MRLYSGSTNGLIDDCTHNRVAFKLKEAFFQEFRYNPPSSEVNAWNNSLRALSQVFQLTGLLRHGILLELQLPLTSKRLDCLVTGFDGTNLPNAVIVELKQWSGCEGAAGRNVVSTFVGGAIRDVLHPSVQVGQYLSYLEDCHTAFQGEGSIALHACAYLHNYSPRSDDPLFLDHFTEQVARCPIFASDDVPRLSSFLKHRIPLGDDCELVARVERSKYRPSRKLLDHVAKVIEGRSEYVLLDEQLVAFDAIMDEALEGVNGRRKSVIIVRGGPGTGKSVLALNLLGKLSANGLNTHYVTGSRAFTSTVRAIVGSRSAVQIRYFNGYSEADVNVVDVMIADEAHRLRSTSNSRFTASAKRTNLPQLHELLKASKTCVFFIDDRQIVRPGEIGSSEYIRNEALKLEHHVKEFTLEAQFRCAGSEAFIGWINNTLSIERTPHVLWNQSEEFEFRIFSTPESLEVAIHDKAGQGSTARLAAGFCWPWSKPTADGSLVNDVVIGAYERPWNARSDAGRLAPGIPKESLWAYDPAGLSQIGCVYTAQGFEFDYIGVIFGSDLTYVPSEGAWHGNPSMSFDTVVKRSGAAFVNLVKNTYRVLLTRGMKGCYVHFTDKDTENFVRSRLEIDPR